MSIYRVLKSHIIPTDPSSMNKTSLMIHRFFTFKYMKRYRIILYQFFCWDNLYLKNDLSVIYCLMIWWCKMFETFYAQKLERIHYSSKVFLLAKYMGFYSNSLKSIIRMVHQVTWKYTIERFYFFFISIF